MTNRCRSRVARAAFAVSLVLLCLGSSVTSARTLRVTYRNYFEGEELKEEGRSLLVTDGRIAMTATAWPEPLVAHAPIEERYLDYEKAEARQSARLSDGSRITTTSAFGTLPKLEATADTATVLGHLCHRARTELRSNRIDVWYTDELQVAGSPSTQFVPETGLVLKIVRNGNYVIEADSLTWLESTSPPRPPADWGANLEGPVYRARVADAFVQRVRVFDHAPLNWDDKTPNAPDSTGLLHFGNGTIVARRVRLPRVSNDYAVFAELIHRSKGDAYDRTGTVFLASADQARSVFAMLRGDSTALSLDHGRDGSTYLGLTTRDRYTAPLEAIRFITSFGAGQFSKQVTVPGLSFADSVAYREDLSSLLPVLQGEVWFFVSIGHYVTPGHEVSLELSYYPGDRFAKEISGPSGFVRPLLSTVELIGSLGSDRGRLFEHDSLRVRFEVPKGATKLGLRYFTTGHGGWGNGDEFVPRTNRLFVDGELVAAITPWRSDCRQYRERNPASGNFWNGLSSSDFSRSGWCPGAVVDPYWVPLPELAPGAHELRVVIPMGAPEGGSTSSWNVSAALLGEWTQAPATDR